jgi:sarcosine oxidase subunit alpha
MAEHGVLPGAAVAVVGEGDEADALGAAFSRAGLRVVCAPSADGGRVVGRSRVRALALPDRRIACDTIALATPPAPATELARELGIGVALDAAAGAFTARAGAHGATAVPGVFAAGEVTGAMDAARAIESGRRAGEAARG